MKFVYLLVCFAGSSLAAENQASIEQELSSRFCAKKTESKSEDRIRSLKNLKELEISLSDLYPELEAEDSLQVDEESNSNLAEADEESTSLRGDSFEEKIQQKEQSLPQKCNQEFLLKTRQAALNSNQSPSDQQPSFNY